MFLFFLWKNGVEVGEKNEILVFKKNAVLKHGKQDISQTTWFHKGCNCYESVSTTQRLHCEMQMDSITKTQTRRGEAGRGIWG